MNVSKTDIEGVVIIEPRVFADRRGYFFESYSRREFDKAVAPVRFVQDNESRSVRGVVRGLHFQRPPYAQAKLVRCTEGRVLDVAVDIRPGSATFGRVVAVELSADNKRQLFLPRGMAHGFAVLSDEAVFQYKCDNYYAPQAEGGIDPTDADLAIDWGVDLSEAILSEKDTQHPSWHEFCKTLHNSTGTKRAEITVLVTGANGQLGRSLQREAAASPGRARYIFTDVAELDITDAGDVELMLQNEKIDVIVNCAAYTDVERAESEPDRARLLNAKAPAILAAAAARAGATLIHISTDYVFGGHMMNTPVAEDVEPCPTGVYGLTKLEGEHAIAASGCKAIVLRTAWLYSEFGRNFMLTMLRLTTERPELHVVCDQTGTPTYAGDLAHAIYEIIEKELYEGREGLYHYSNEGACTWHDFAHAIARLSGHDGSKVLPCRSADYPSAVVRPAYSVLDKSKFRSTFGIEVPYWEDSLTKCIRNYVEA